MIADSFVVGKGSDYLLGAHQKRRCRELSGVSGLNDAVLPKTVYVSKNQSPITKLLDRVTMSKTMNSALRLHPRQFA